MQLFDAERYNKEFAKDVSTNQFLLEQELQRIEKSKSKNMQIWIVL